SLSAARPGVFERRPGAARRRVASCPPRPVEPPGIDRRAPPAAADRAPARETPARPDSLAHPRHIPLRPALADEVLSLERPLAGSGATAPVRPGRAAGGGSLRQRRRRARALGPRGPQRSARRRPSAHGPRRRSRRAAHPAAAVAARRSGGTALVRVVRGAQRRCARRSRLARVGDPRTAFAARRVARRRAGHVGDGHPHSRTAAASRREALMGNVALYRKLLRQTLPYWAGIAGLLALELLASGVALLNPVPVKLVVDSVLGTRPLPAFLQRLVVGSAADPATPILALALALVALIVSPPLFFLPRIYRPRMRSQSLQAKKLESSALAVVQEALGALRVVKAFGQEARETDRFLRRSREGMAARMSLALLEGRYGLLVGLTTALGTAAVLFVGVSHVRS